MGQEQSILEKNGYKLEAKIEKANACVATKDGNKFVIRKLSTSTNADLIAEIETLRATTHPHIISNNVSFSDENQDDYYVVSDYYEQSLTEKIKETNQEFEILSWTAEICLALKTMHQKELFHRQLTPENIFFKESGILCLGGFGKVKSNSNDNSEVIDFLAPEVFTLGLYVAKSDVWSVGCILNELCTGKKTFSAETCVQLIPKIISGEYSPLPCWCSPELCELLKDILKPDLHTRPTAAEILEKPIMIRCLLQKIKNTEKDLQLQLENLRTVADNLERVHQGTTIGSLAGGVVGAVGGITSIVGLILAPFTLGASIIVTGVGVGVGAVGGLTAGTSNITNLVKQSSDRRTFHTIIKGFGEKFEAVALWLQEIHISLQMIRNRYHSDDEDSSSSQDTSTGLGSGRLGRVLGGIPEVLRLVRLVKFGELAAQASKVVRVAEVASGVLSGLFVAADIFFIAMDARELHHIRQANANSETRSEIMRFVRSIRNTADELQIELLELRGITAALPSLEDEYE